MPSKKSRPSRGAPVLNQPAPAIDRTRLWLLLILALAAILRLYALGTIPHGFTNDEAQDGLSARQALHDGLQVFYPENNGREGLYINLATPLVWMLGDTISAMRLPAAFFGVLTVWLTYLLGARLFDNRTGLLGGLFVATSTWHLFNCRLTNRAAAAPLFLALTLWLLFHMIGRVRGGRPYAAWTILAGAVYGLGFHTYTSFRLTPLLILPVCIYCLARARAEGLWRDACLAASGFAAAAAATVAPLVLYFSKHPEMFALRASQVSVWSQPDWGWRVFRNCWAVAQMCFWRGDTDWKNNIAGHRELFLPVALLFAVGVGCAVIAMVRCVRQHRPPNAADLLILLWMGIGVLPSVLTVDGIHALRASLTIPPVCLAAAIGAVRVYAWLESRMSRSMCTAAAVCFVAVACLEPCQTYFREWATDEHVARDFEDWLVDEGSEIRDAPLHPAKYVAIPRPVFRAIEVPQVILYLTRTATEADRRQANINYVFPKPNELWNSREFCALVKQQHPDGQVFCVSRAAPLRP